MGLSYQSATTRSIRVLLQVSAAQLLVWFPADASQTATEGVLCAWACITHV